jgi:hypothetical protein
MKMRPLNFLDKIILGGTLALSPLCLEAGISLHAGYEARQLRNELNAPAPYEINDFWEWERLLQDRRDHIGVYENIQNQATNNLLLLAVIYYAAFLGVGIKNLGRDVKPEESK